MIPTRSSHGQVLTDDDYQMQVVMKALAAQKQKLRARNEWLDKLVTCESGGRPGAINPMDRDGTASYGLLQFKPSTFAAYSKRYKIPGQLMDPVAQRSITLRMMDDPTVRWQNEFPACVRKLGLPPYRVVQ